MAAHPFLSAEWIAAASDLRDEYQDRVPPIEMSLSVNVNVVDTPFGADAVVGHIDTSTGTLVIEEGHLEGADLTVELRYELARSLFVARDLAAAMQAFFAGQIKVTGDSAKLLEIQPPSAETAGHPLVSELARRIDEITAPP